MNEHLMLEPSPASPQLDQNDDRQSAISWNYPQSTAPLSPAHDPVTPQAVEEGFGGYEESKEFFANRGRFSVADSDFASSILRQRNLSLLEAQKRRDWYDTASTLRLIIFWIAVILCLAGGIISVLATVPVNGGIGGQFTVNVCNIMVATSFLAGPVNSLQEITCIQFLQSPQAANFTAVLSGHSLVGPTVIYGWMPGINAALWVLVLIIFLVASTQLSGIMRTLVEPGATTYNKKSSIPLGVKAAVIEYCEHSYFSLYLPYTLFAIWLSGNGKEYNKRDVWVSVFIAQYMLLSTVMLGSSWFDQINMGAVFGSDGSQVMLCAWYRSISYAALVIVHAVLGAWIMVISTRVYNVYGGQMELAIWLTGIIRGNDGSLDTALYGMCDYGNFGFRVRSVMSKLKIGLVDTTPSEEVGHLAYTVYRDEMAPSGLIEERSRRLYFGRGDPLE